VHTRPFNGLDITHLFGSCILYHKLPGAILNYTGVEDHFNACAKINLIFTYRLYRKKRAKYSRIPVGRW